MTQFALLSLADGSELHADSRSALVDQIIAGHGTADEHAALELRASFLAGAADHAQATVMAALTEAAPEAVAGLSDDALSVIYHLRGEEHVEAAVWDSDIPLFLLGTGYSPYTGNPVPAGDSVHVLDPLNETTFLDALQAAGLAELYVREDLDD